MSLRAPNKLAATLIVGATLAIGLSMFAEPLGIASSDEFRNNDWLNCRSFDVLTRRALVEDGEFPLRTHLLGGGFPVIAHPSDGSWAPTIVPVLLFGDVIGVKINILLFLLAGGWGIWLLAHRILEMGVGGSLFAALLFLVSGWLPSMLLVGFYNQLFFLVTPLVLYLLLDSPGRPDRLIAAGFLLCLVLQQGGHAFPAVCFFCGLCCWLFATTERDDSKGRFIPAARGVGLLLLWTAPLAIGRGMGAAWPVALGWALAVAWMAGTGAGRTLSKKLWPWGLRFGLVLTVACSLGAARLIGLGLLSDDGQYEHSLQRQDALWFPDRDGPPQPEERFYDSLPDFLSAAMDRVPETMEYRFTWGREGDPVGHEYAFLGLTLPGLVLGLLGLPLLLRDRRSTWACVAGLLLLGVCFGWRAPPDFHFLLTWGIPTLDAFSQPIKYWNFFVLLWMVLAAGAAAGWALDRFSQPTTRRAATCVLFGLLVLPWAQNRAVFEETFAHPRPAGANEPYHQVMLVAEEEWAQMTLSDVRTSSDSLHLRDYVRPDEMTEYLNIQRGVGTIDWYGSLVMARESSVPKEFVTLDGAPVSIPSYRGEVWLAEGEESGTVRDSIIGHNTLWADVELESAGTVVFNQNWLEGFVASSGELVEHEGLIGLALPSGPHSVTLSYRPTGLRLGLVLSAVALVGWGGFWCVLLRRRWARRPEDHFNISR